MAEIPTPRGRAKRRDPDALTIYDVAKLAHVSTATVSRVVNGNYPVSAGTRAKVEKAMDQLGYVVNAHARALAGSQTRLIGIVINEIVDPYFAYIARGVQFEARERGRLCLVCNSHGDERQEDAFLELLREQRADVVILVGGVIESADYERKTLLRARQLEQAGSRLVLCGRPALSRRAPIVRVEYDNEQGAFAITDHLLSAGHTRILYLGGPTKLSTTVSRVRGFERAHTARGLAADPTLIRTGAFGRTWGYRHMLDVLDDGLDFTGVFCANDIVAAGAYQAIKERGLRIPHDLSVVGYDDVPVAAELDPGLTTVRVPLEAMGREAVRAGLAQQAVDSDPFAPDYASTSLGSYVIVRGSVATPAREPATDA